mmetsp:Transcript_3097/g.3650  ORF Transcript_3097/g.3650 Transcript_3097/m.3650 type:complete len:122 (-) Transcript_3097:144-509(-)
METHVILLTEALAACRCTSTVEQATQARFLLSTDSMMAQLQILVSATTRMANLIGPYHPPRPFGTTASSGSMWPLKSVVVKFSVLQNLLLTSFPLFGQGVPSGMLLSSAQARLVSLMVPQS